MIEKLTKQLTTLFPGYRGCFWLSLEPKENQTAMVFSPSKNNVEQELAKLKKITSKLQLTTKHSDFHGLVGVNLEGTIQLSGRDLPNALIPIIADWVEQHIQQHPKLARLKDLEIATIDKNGKWSQKYAAARAWSQVSSEIVPGTIPDSLSILQNLSPLEEANFWMAQQSVDGLPFLMITTQKDDSNITDLRNKVYYLRTHVQPGSPVVWGTIIKMESGTLAWFSTAELDTATTILRAVFSQFGEKYPKLDVIQKSRFLRIKDGDVVGHRYVMGVDYDDSQPVPPESNTSSKESGAVNKTLKLLASLEGKSKLAFFFCKQGLFLDKSKTTLKAKILDKGWKGINGQLRFSSKGYIEFSSATDKPDFLQKMIRFVAKNWQQQPILKQLNKSRFIVRNKEGEPIARYKADVEWEKINFSV